MTQKIEQSQRRDRVATGAVMQKVSFPLIRAPQK